MAMQAMWVHGSSVVPGFPGGAGLEGTNGHRLEQVDGHAWTDLTGLRASGGATFKAAAGNSNTFTFSIPTPVVRLGVVNGPREQFRANLLRVFVLYRLDPNVAINQVMAVDGDSVFQDASDNPTSIFSDLSTGGNHGGSDIRTEAELDSALVEGVTKFSLREPGVVFKGVGIQVDVSWGVDGEVTFIAAGADFEVQDS
jgi:hypothetical protein